MVLLLKPPLEKLTLISHFCFYNKTTIFFLKMSRRVSRLERSKIGVTRLFSPSSRVGTSLRPLTINNLVRGYQTRIREENIRLLVEAYDSEDYQFSYIIQVITPDGDVFTHSTPFTNQRRVYREGKRKIELLLLKYFGVKSIDEIPNEYIGSEGVRVENVNTGEIKTINLHEHTSFQGHILEGIDYLVG